MTRTAMTATAFATIISALAVEAGRRGALQPGDLGAAVTAAGEAHPGLLYGRVTTEDGVIYEGRLRFGGDEEALWSNYFNGFKHRNPWLAQVPAEVLPRERHALSVRDVEIAVTKQAKLGRPFMARFGDIARIEARGRDLRVTLKSGSVFHLDRYAADDFADGVRVWDDRRGVIDLEERQVRSIEFLAAEHNGAADSPLYGTVHTRQGSFTGLIQWNRKECVVSDVLNGRGDSGDVSLPFATIRSIARAGGGSVVTLLDGRRVVLSGRPEVGAGNRGIYVDDERYGRVLVSWQAFERADFAAGRGLPAYPDFRAGRALTGSVITRSGQQYTGRVVYDLDESETTETLDAPARGVDYTIPFARIASIEPRGAGVIVVLHNGEALPLERAGDLGAANAGLLIFADGRDRPVYVPWSEVARLQFDQ